MGSNNPMFGKKQTEETKKKISDKAIERYKDKNSEYYIRWHANLDEAMKSPETRKKISDKSTGRKHSNRVYAQRAIRENLLRKEIELFEITNIKLDIQKLEKYFTIDSLKPQIDEIIKTLEFVTPTWKYKGRMNYIEKNETNLKKLEEIEKLKAIQKHHNYSECAIKRSQNPDYIEKIRIAKLKQWENPELRDKFIKNMRDYYDEIQNENK